MKAAWLERDDVVIMTQTGNVYQVLDVQVIIEDNIEYIFVDYGNFSTTYNRNDELLVARKGQVS